MCRGAWFLTRPDLSENPIPAKKFTEAHHSAALFEERRRSAADGDEYNDGGNKT
jgi:pyoverdine/dityrosine biosynthesis protein Dit1